MTMDVGDYLVAVIMPYGRAAIRSTLDGRVTHHGRVVAVSTFANLSAFRERQHRAHAVVVAEQYFEELTIDDVGDAVLVIMRKSRFTLRRESFRFTGVEIGAAEVPDDLLRLLPIDIYRKGPYHRRLLRISAFVVFVLVLLLIWWGAP